MNKSLPSLEDFLTMQSVQIPTWSFAINLLLSALLAVILAKFYTTFGKSLSNRKQFAGNFLLIAMTTMLIISIVKASLALSLGLVGALSIVRFRSAIKEPEELAYLFLVIAIGLGFGADQRLITLMAFGLILIMLWIHQKTEDRTDQANLYMTIGTNGQKKVALKDIVDVLTKHSTDLELKRFDEDKNRIEVAFSVGFKSFAELEESKSSLYDLNESFRISIIDQHSIGG